MWRIHGWSVGNLLGVVGVVVLVGGCAGGGARPGGAGGGGEAVVGLEFHSFNPKRVTIDVGQTVRWENKTLIWHTVTANPALAKRAQDVALPPGAEAFDSGKVDVGQSFEHRFTVPGTYRYFCQPHELKGMVGEVVVRPGGK